MSLEKLASTWTATKTEPELAVHSIVNTLTYKLAHKLRQSGEGPLTTAVLCVLYSSDLNYEKCTILLLPFIKFCSSNLGNEGDKIKMHQHTCTHTHTHTHTSCKYIHTYIHISYSSSLAHQQHRDRHTEPVIMQPLIKYHKSDSFVFLYLLQMQSSFCGWKAEGSEATLSTIMMQNSWGGSLSVEIVGYRATLWNLLMWMLCTLPAICKTLQWCLCVCMCVCVPFQLALTELSLHLGFVSINSHALSLSLSPSLILLSCLSHSFSSHTSISHSLSLSLSLSCLTWQSPRDSSC